ncbi:MAG: IS200/IS605 family transposase [Methylococcaceae bacterium]|nr:MAG: IS200/IS605 family transposase [Methylococcaceae bacterium]
MASTYLSLHYHIVFGTKNRAPMIDAEWRPRLYDYLGGIIRKLGGFSECIGGIEDHVHLLVSLKATHSLADLVRELKKASSVWVHDALGEKQFAWQEGYAAFTVSASMLDTVQKYITHQEQHHRVKSCREELVEILEKSGVDYNPDYL